MKGKKWLHALIVSLVAAFGALAIACGDKNDGKGNNKPSESPAVGVYYYEVGENEYLLSLNADKTVALSIRDTAISGKYEVKDNGAITFTVTGNDKLLNTAKYESDEVTLTYDGTIYKFLRRVDYTVTFNSGSGSAVDSKTVRNGKKLEKPADPEYAGHVFIGWYKDSAATDAYKFASDVVKGNMTLYAGWVVKTERDEYTVKFDLGYDYESLYATATTVNGKVYKEVTDPARDSYAFKGWWVKDAESGEYSYRVDLASYEFVQNETVYALWQGAAEGGKLDAPVVTVDVANNRLSWDAVEGASGYSVKVTDPDGGEWTRTEQGTSVEYANKFDKAGTYTVEVYAVSAASADRNSATTTRKVTAKQLARVSNFNVTGDVLTFSGVQNATKYLLYITCGDKNHNHNPIDNGNSKEFNFADCDMGDDGIKFVVEAQADGYVSSRSEEYVVAKKLDKATGFTYDSVTQTVAWAPVENAASYFVKVTCDNPAHVIETEVRNATSINIGECTVGAVKVTVVAKNNRKYIPSDDAQYSVSKTEWAAVTGLSLNDTTLTWKKQSRVKNYIVEVNGVTKEVAEGNSLDLETIDNLTWEIGKVYDIKVRAELNNGELTSWSLPLSTAYKTMTELKYSEGKVSWTPVFGIGSAGYKVVVNGAAPVSVDASSYKVTLTDKTNVIKVYIGNADETTAKSITVNAYKLTLNGNGGTDNLEARYYAKGDPIALPAADVATRRGYNLTGWYTSAEGNSAGYVNGEPYDLDKDLTLYARWDGKVYTVRLNYNIRGDNADEIVTVKVKFGSEYSLGIPTTPKSLMHGFLQWNLAKDGKGIAVSDSNGDGAAWNLTDNNVMLYAKWAEIFEFEKAGSGNDAYYIVRQGVGTPLVNEVAIPEQYQAEDDTRMYPVKVIGGNAFNSCKKMQVINIPATIETIEDTAFTSCTMLEQINVTGARPGIDKYWSVDGVLYGINDITEKSELKIYPIGRSGDFTLADGIEELAYHSLYRANINTLTLPSSFTRVANSAFESSRITEVIFAEPKNANENVQPLIISNGAFYSASSLKSVTLPSRKVIFGDGETADFKADIFRSCNQLETVYVTAGNAEYTSIDGMLCEIYPATKELTLVFCPVNYQFGTSGVYRTSNRLSFIGDKAFSGVKNLRVVEIDVSITDIGEHAFSGYTAEIDGRNVVVSNCQSLVKLTIFGGRAAKLTIGATAFGSDTSSTSASYNLSTVEFQEGSNVSVIGDYAFAYCRIFSVTLPNSLTRLGDGAFSDCRQLGTVTFGVNDEEGFEFGEDVFRNCVSLEKVILPKNITSFEGGVFAGCDSLETIEVDPENPVLVFVDGVLYGKDATTGKITSIHFVPVGVDLTDFVLPDGITEINAGVFGNAGSSIKKLTINKYVTYIGLAAFAKTGLEEVIFENGDPNDPNDDGAKTLSIAAPSGINAYTDGLFYQCSSLKRVVLPARLTTIPYGMFAHCFALTSIDLTGVTSIGDFALYYTGLSGTLTIPRTVESIGYYAFNNCKSLEKVVFEDERTTDLIILNRSGIKDGLDNDNNFVSNGSNTDRIASYTFSACSELTEVHLPEKLVNIGSSMFSSCSKLTTINIPASVRSIRASAFSSCSKLANITFATRTAADELYLEDGYSTDNYGSTCGLFQSLPIKEMVFPTGTVRIPNYCFKSCSSLTTVYIPNTVRNIVNEKGKAVVFGMGSSVFSSANNVTTVTFEADNPADLANPNYPGLSMSSSGLPTGSKFTSVILPARLADYYSTANSTEKTMVAANISSSNLTSISVMEGCKDYYSQDGILYNTAGTEIKFCPRGKTGVFTIPYSVNKIGDSAFNSCAKITGFTFEAKPAEATATENDEADDSLIIGNSAFTGCTNAAFTSITIPARVTSIGTNAFTRCTNLTSITIEDGALPLVIGDSAFTSCSKLTSFTIPTRVTSIGVQAFSGLSKITQINFASDGNLTTIGNNAFEKTGITSVILPDSVNIIGKQVFANCTSLTTASLPLTINNFVGLFLNCSKLTSITYREVAGKPNNLLREEVDHNEYPGEYAVYGSDGSFFYYPQSIIPNKGTANEGVLTIKSGTTTLAQDLFSYNPYIKKVIIPNTVTKIGINAFYFMPALEEVVFEDDTAETAQTALVLEDTGSSTGGRTFAGCNLLKKINFPARLQSLPVEAFLGCTSLSEVTFAEGCKLVALPNKAFQYTSSLKSITLPANVGRLGQYTFQYSAITGIVIPASYEFNSSDTYTFANCEDLTSVEFKSPAQARENMQVSGNMFNGCSKLTTVILPDDVAQIGSSSFVDCVSLQEINLPESLTSIGEYAFKGCVKLNSINRTDDDPVGTVNIPSMVNNIGRSAFHNCVQITYINLTDVTVALSLGIQAFAATGITEITIPNTVKTLSAIFNTPNTTTPANTADICKDLETVIFEDDNTGLTSIPAGMFMMLPNLKTVVLPRGLTGNNKLTINEYAFYGTKLESVVIPKETAYIKFSAFRDCPNLTTVTFEKYDNGNCSLQMIGNYAFSNSGITSITIPASAKFQNLPQVITNPPSYSSNVFDNCVDLETVVFEEGSVINSFVKFPRDTTSDHASHFLNCTSLKNVTLPENLFVVDVKLFQGCTALQSITIPANVTLIDNYAFDGCSKLTNIVFEGTNLSEIGSYVFRKTGLTAFAAPASLKTIGESAFDGCTKLESVTYAEGSNMRTIGQFAFNGCSKLAAINLPDSITSIGNSAYQNCKAATTVTLPHSLKTIGNNPFINCNNITEIIAPVYGKKEKVYFVEDNGAIYNGDKSKLYFFYDRTATEFTLLEETAEIAANAFWGMPVSTVVANTYVAEEEDAVFTIGNSAFRYSSISSITLGDNVDIGSYAFANCGDLERITLPNGANVASAAFANSTNLTSILLAEDTLYGGYNASFKQDGTLVLQGKESGDDCIIDTRAFSGDVTLVKVEIAEGVTKINDNAFYSCSNLVSVKFPSTLKTIGVNAFRDTGLTSVDLSACSELTTIGNLAFTNATSVQSITLPTGGKLATIGTYAFAGTAITEITIPNTVTSFGATSKTNSNNVFFWDTCVCEELETITFEAVATGQTSYLKTLYDGSFKSLPKLKSVTLPSKLETLGGGGSYTTFGGTKITSITIPDTLKTIDSYVFDGATMLSSVSVLNSATNASSNITSIGASAFRGTALSGEISIPQKVTTIDAGAFFGVTGITSVKFVANSSNVTSLTTIKAGAFKGCNLSSIEIPEKVTTLGGTSGSTDVGVFEDCSNLSEVTFKLNSSKNTALTTIGYNTFKGTAITEFVVPATVTTKLYPAFANTQLQSITLTGVTELPANGFANLTSLATVVFSDKLSKIGKNCFDGCTGITKLVIPESITAVSEAAFNGWTSTQTICFSDLIAPRSGFALAWGQGCAANVVWNYQEPESN